MRTLCASVLAFEAIIVLLAVPVAVVVRGIAPGVGITFGAVLVVACIVVAGSQRRSWGVTAGWALQVIILLLGFVVPAMFVLGVIFAILWFYAIRVGRRGDAIEAAGETAGETASRAT